MTVRVIFGKPDTSISVNPTHADRLKKSPQEVLCPVESFPARQTAN